MSNLVSGKDGLSRCGWCGDVDAFIPYHDNEWGYPVDDNRRLFEKICLESFQSGLSWRLILDKRENFRAAFDGFDYHRVATYGDEHIARLVKDAGIIRHQGKILATINNAKRAIEMEKQEGSLAAYFWRHEPSPETPGIPQSVTTIPEAVALSKDLKKRGWKFVGPTTVFSFMQAMGLVNDHAIGCSHRAKATAARTAFKKPS